MRRGRGPRYRPRHHVAVYGLTSGMAVMAVSLALML
jgi:hypothetical protein